MKFIKIGPPLLIIFVLTGFLVIPRISSNTGLETKKQKPNIIFILADDLGYGDVGSFGQEYIETPNLDLLAKEGIRFTNHYAGNAVCAPSRCSLVTGKHMGHAEVRGNMQAQPSGQLPLSSEAVTVASLLKQAGYATAMIGKWGLGIEGSSGEPNKQGFDYYYGYLDQVLAHNYFPEYLIRNGKKETLDNEVNYLSKEAWHKGLGSYSTKKIDYSNDLFTADALRFIDKNKSKPFFLYLPYTIPHDNGEALVGERMEVPEFGIYENQKDWDSDKKGYAAMVSRLDNYVGQIIMKLRELNIDDNTLLIFTSDNGPEMQYDCKQFFDSNGILRGGKRDLYEGGIKEPFIAWWPNQIQAGAVSEHISAFWDFLPTACDVAGIDVPDETDGISYLPTLLGKDDQPKHEYLYWEFYEKNGARAVLKDKWKVVQNDTKLDKNAPIELYNLEEDPGETKNVAHDYPEIISEMKETMTRASSPSPYFHF